MADCADAWPVQLTGTLPSLANLTQLSACQVWARAKLQVSGSWSCRPGRLLTLCACSWTQMG